MKRDAGRVIRMIEPLKRMKEKVARDKGVKQAQNNGSMTVELALLMPLLLTVFVLVIHGSIFLYNRETIETIACLALHRGLQMEHDGKKAVQGEVEAYLDQCLSEKLLLGPAVSKQVTVSLTSVSVTIEISQNIPVPGLPRLLRGDGSFHARVRKKGTRMDPAGVLWAVSGGKEMQKQMQNQLQDRTQDE